MLFPQGPLLFSGHESETFTEAVCRFLDVRRGKLLIGSFNDRETRVEFEEPVRGRDVYFVQSIAAPVNHRLMETLIAIDALKRASAGRITAVLPYLGYSRYYMKSQSRTPIAARVVSNLFEAAGADRVLTLDLHSPSIQGFFDIPLDHLLSKYMFSDLIKAEIGNSVTIVAPDVNGVARARALADLLGVDIAIVDKSALQSDLQGFSSEPDVGSALIGDVKEKVCVIIDDICDSAKTICAVANVLQKANAAEVYSVITHGVFSGEALRRIQNSSIKRLFVSDSINAVKQLDSEKIFVVSFAETFARAIRRIHSSDSIADLFG